MNDSPAGSSQTVRWIVSGRVQGVGFRYHVVQAARRHGVSGDVRNLPDGGVEVRARASSARLRALLLEVEAGPRWARVEQVRSEELAEDLWFDGFDVRF